jgi:hypothetical protein
MVAALAVKRIRGARRARVPVPRRPRGRRGNLGHLERRDRPRGTCVWAVCGATGTAKGNPQPKKRFGGANRGLTRRFDGGQFDAIGSKTGAPEGRIYPF